MCDNAKLRDFIASKTDAVCCIVPQGISPLSVSRWLKVPIRGMVMKKSKLNTQTDETTNVLSNTVVVCVVLVLVVALILLVRRRHKHLND